MTTTFAFIIIFGLIFDTLFIKMRLPGFLGMLILGVIIGPHVFNMMDVETLKISDDLRKIALIVILLRAGLGISRKSLNKVGITAFKLSFIPAIIEGGTIAFISIKLLNFSFIEGGMLGFIISSVSPAVVVPRMIHYLDNGIGTDKDIPTMLLAGSSVDNVFSITMFTAFLGFYSNRNINIGISFLSIPVSIFLGIIFGIIIGFILIKIFNMFHIRDTKKVLILLGMSFLLNTIENTLKSKIEIAGLLGVMTIGFIILEKKPELAKRLAKKFDKIWVFAEIILFVLVGSKVNIKALLNSGGIGLIIIFIGLFARSIGVILSTAKTNLNHKEKLFCVVSYVPKATVQAAIGAIPLTFNVPSGEIILAIAVLSIIITAPLGSILINVMAKRLLTSSNFSQ